MVSTAAAAVARLVLAVREPEQRFVLVRLLRISGRRLQLVDRARPLFVGNEILRALHALGLERPRRGRQENLRREQG